MNKYYTGIGSRVISEDERSLIHKLSGKLYQEGYTLRSGCADGADTAFWEGLQGVADWHTTPPPCQLFLPWVGFNGHSGWPLYETVCDEDWPYFYQAKEIMTGIHPAPDRLTRGAMALHTRNVPQILGPTLDKRSSFVIFCSDQKGTEVKGGTRTAVELARDLGIKTFNLRVEQERQRLEEWVWA